MPSGVSSLDVAQTLQLALAEQRVGFFVRGGEQREIIASVAKEDRDAVQANVDVALEQFEAGTITSVELCEVEEQFIQAESRLLTAQFEAKQAEVELLRLSGQLLDRVQK